MTDKPSDYEVAIQRLTAWVHDHGDSKPKAFVGDISFLLLAAQEARETERKQEKAKEWLENGCRLYCRWYDTGLPRMGPDNAAYEMVSAMRRALAELKGEQTEQDQ